MFCVEWYNLPLPFPVSCYTVGTHSRCLRVWERALGEMDGFFHEVKVIRTHRGPTGKGESEKKKKILLFYGKVATLGWDPDRWRWRDGSCFLNYSTKGGRETIVSRNPEITRTVEKWQGYIPGNYRLYWSHVWDSHRAGKEAAFIWSIWHKAVAVNEWRARIAPATISQ